MTPSLSSSAREEFSYPSGNENVYSSYAGEGGVPLDSFLKRVAFAIRLSDANVLLSDEIDGGTRIQFHRQIKERVRQITPFIALDRDPYLVVTDDGRLVWIRDAYTISSRYPYSTPAPNGLNYIRNSVKVVSTPMTAPSITTSPTRKIRSSRPTRRRSPTCSIRWRPSPRS